VTQQTQAAQPTPKPAPIRTAEEGENVIARLNTIMERLETIVADETARVRAGQLRAAVELDEEKGDLARIFATESERLRASATMVSASLPDALGRLQARHESFRNLLQTNLTVIATAHAVSEGIIRGVSGELTRKQSPSTYGANGRANQPSPRAAQPLSVSRSL
jgi:flagellar biosynthesis/type III secretory pathway chaperone